MKIHAEPLPAPLREFRSPGGRVFTVDAGEHTERFTGDSLWSDSWPILFNGQPAGKLFRNTMYGLTAAGEGRWQAATRQLYWEYAGDAPVGIGFDVGPFDDAAAACAAWSRSADEILDWSEGKPVVTHYGRTARKQADKTAATRANARQSR